MPGGRLTPQDRRQIALGPGAPPECRRHPQLRHARQTGHHPPGTVRRTGELVFCV